MWARGCLFLALALCAAGPAAHPIHSSLAVVTHVAARREVDVNLRVFADDFAAGVARQPRGPASRLTPEQRYVGASFALWGTDGKRVPLRWCGARREGEVVWVCLRGPLPGGLRGARVLSALQFTLYDDQVNVVQAGDARRKQTIMFVPGDGPKPIPR
ncbi:MAG TPA: DUF6702 family protein [Longimicrobium sp.]|jgi:hypothetical protein